MGCHQSIANFPASLVDLWSESSLDTPYIFHLIYSLTILSSNIIHVFFVSLQGTSLSWNTFGISLLSHLPTRISPRYLRSDLHRHRWNHAFATSRWTASKVGWSIELLWCGGLFSVWVIQCAKEFEVCYSYSIYIIHIHITSECSHWAKRTLTWTVFWNGWFC